MPAFWAQHGYGKADKIDRLKNEGLLEGAVLSPADEESGSLRATTTALGPARALLDPQTYVYSIPGGTARCHGSHGLDFPGLSWGMAASDVGQLVTSVVHANDQLGIGDLIAPTCLQRSFGDVWTGLSLQMARSTLALVGSGRRVFVSCVMDESALDQWRDVETWLDVVTQLDAHGFYIVVSRASQAPYPAAWLSSRLANYLRLVYSLSELNGYEVLAGYADVEGALAVAAGAGGAASGWFYSLRAFPESKWQPSSGGRQANPRVYADGLLTPVLAVGEGERTATSSRGSDALPEASLRSQIGSNAQGWSLTDSWNQHLSGVARFVNGIQSAGSLRSRLNEAETRLSDALALMTALDAEGVPIASAYRPRLASLRDGLAGFRSAESV